MRQSLSWEADRSSQDIPRILWNPNIHHRLHNSPPLVLILSQIDPVHVPHPTSWKSILILSFHLQLGIPSGLFPPGFHTCYMPSQSHSSRFDHSNNMWRGVQIMKLSLCSFIPLSYHLVSLRTKYPPQHPILEHPQSMSSSYVRGQVSHPHKKQVKL